MTQPARGSTLPPSLAPYVEGLRELKNWVELADHFVLVPVEIPGPDLARALGQWLAAEGHPPVFVEPDTDEEWEQIVGALLDATPAPDGLVIFIGRYHPPDAFRRGMHFVNRKRDSIAEHLHCPLFWCGPASFLRLTGEYAPDFWSIRAVDRRLVPVAEPPAVADSDARPSLRELFSHAKAQGDHANAAALAIRVVDALIHEGAVDEAESVIEEGLSGLSKKQIDLRAELLLRKAEIARRHKDDRGALNWLDRLLLDPEVDPYVRMRARLLMGSLWRDPAKTTSAYTQALDVARTLPDPEGEALALMGLGEVGSRSGKSVETVLAPIEQAQAIAVRIGRADLEAAALAVMALAVARLHDKPKARQWLAEAAALGQTAGPREAAAWLVHGVFDRACASAKEMLDSSATLVAPDPSREPRDALRPKGETSQATPEPVAVMPLAPRKAGTRRILWALPAAAVAAASFLCVRLWQRADQAEMAIQAARDAAAKQIAEERGAIASSLARHGSPEVEALIAGVKAVGGDQTDHPAETAVRGLRDAVKAALRSFPLRGHKGPIQAAAFAPDGLRVVTAGADHTARLWDARYGNPLAVLQGHTGELLDVKFSPDGRSVLTTSKDHTARIWNLEDGRLLTTFQRHSDSITAIAFSPEGYQVVTGSSDGVRLWRAHDGIEIATSPNPLADAERLYLNPSIADVAFSPDATLIYIVDRNNRPIFFLWDLQRKRVQPYIQSSHRLRAEDIRGVSLSPRGTQAVVNYFHSYPPNTFLFNLLSSSEPVLLKSSELPMTRTAERVIFSPDGRWIITIGDRLDSLPPPHGKPILHGLSLWDASNGLLVWEPPDASLDIDYAAFSHDGKQFITAGKDGKLRRWDTTSRSLLATLQGPPPPLRGAWLSPDHKRLLTLGSDSTARLWTADPDPIAQAETWDPMRLIGVACEFLRGQPELTGVEAICNRTLVPRR